MSGSDWALIITAATGLFALIGKGVAWLVALIQAQAKSAIEAKDRELATAHERIHILEQALHDAGVTLP